MNTYQEITNYVKYLKDLKAEEVLALVSLAYAIGQRDGFKEAGERFVK